jgi:hypothetical protein
VDSAELTRKLEQAKQAKARLEGQRDRLEADLKALGHDTIQSAKDELERLQQYVDTNKPDLEKRVAAFEETHGATLATFSGGR